MSRLFFRGEAEAILDPEARTRAIANADRYANRSTLRPLKDLQLIRAIRPWLRGEEGGLCRRETNVLTDQGAALVQAWYEEEGKGRRLRWSPSVFEFDGTNQAHAEAIVDVYVAFKRAVTSPLLFWGWKDDRELARLSGEGGTTLRTGIPDAVFVLSCPRDDGYDHLPCFVEVDRGTETVWAGDGRKRDWKGKIERYETYFAGPVLRDPLFRGMERSPLVLCLTTSPRRLEHLLEATAAVSRSDRYAFATLDAVLAGEPQAVLDGVLWLGPGNTSPRPLRELLDGF
ncbi:MAG: replication-relaxation family protein [Chloroflexota bacterium]|nr:replication-relaxation family protein [Chloroflexota bacterium]